MTISCTPACWQEQRCEVCRRPIPPSGRSVALESVAGYCSSEDCSGHPIRNPRHLWDEHDSVRRYTDSTGWELHIVSYEQCQVEI